MEPRWSVASRAAVLAGIGASMQDTVLVVDQDRLIAAERSAGTAELMATLDQNFQRLGRNAPFMANAAAVCGHRPTGRCRAAGVLHARMLAGLLHIHAEVEHVDQNLHMPLRLEVATHHAERQMWLAILRDERRDDCVERTLVRFQPIRVLGVESEQATPILQREADVARHDL